MHARGKVLFDAIPSFSPSSPSERDSRRVALKWKLLCQMLTSLSEEAPLCFLAPVSSRGHAEVLEVLLATGDVDVHQENDWGYSLPIYVGSVKSSMPHQYQNMLALLSEHIKDPEAEAEKRWTQAPKRD